MSASELDHDLTLIESWAQEWKMSFNPAPTKQAIELLFSRRRSREARPPLYFNNQIVTSANDHKHLGIVLDCKLTFAKYIREIIAKARTEI